MQGNRSRDTTPEMRLRRALFAQGLRYRVCARPLPDVRRTADIVFRSARVAVEVRGCFWHGCPAHYKPPKSNTGYWRQKIERNIARDKDTERLFLEAGWHLLVVWEHDDLDLATRQVLEAVRNRVPPRLISLRSAHGRAN
jgi:DNA mismatch endonuclease (patch repair protein)